MSPEEYQAQRVREYEVETAKAFLDYKNRCSCPSNVVILARRMRVLTEFVSTCGECADQEDFEALALVTTMWLNHNASDLLRGLHKFGAGKTNAGAGQPGSDVFRDC